MSGKILAFAAVIAVLGLVLFNMEEQYKPVSSFQTFKFQHNKNYASLEEESYRKSIFLMNLAKIDAHNSDSTQTYVLGVTQFADLTQDEFVGIYLNTKLNKKFTDQDTARTMMPSEKNGNVDWVAAGKVSRVKDQGQCGSCWAFSATGSIESALLVSRGQASDLSEQQLVDCSRSYGNMGCNGGWMDSAFSYVKDHGITTQGAYPYRAVDQSCAINSGDVRVTGFVDVPGCSNLENALSQQPISVAVDASNWGLYRGGVLSTCGTAINHGVLLVGSTNDYWTVKNSWASGWGESGFIRLAKGNTCAVCGYGSYPTV